MGEPSEYDRMNVDDILRDWWNDHETYGRVLAIARDVGADQKSGKLYHVEIPDDGTYLLWDKPLSEQPEAVKKALDNVKAELESKGVLDAYLDHANADWEDLTGNELYRLLKKASMDDAISENGPGVVS